MERNIVNGIQNKRLIELRKENIPTVVLSHQLSVLQKYQSSEVLLFDGVGRKSNESTLREHHAYLKQDSTVSEITSKGCISKIPLIPTVTFYIIVIIIIGMTLAFHQKKSILQDPKINIEEIYKLLKRTIDRGKGIMISILTDYPKKVQLYNMICILVAYKIYQLFFRMFGRALCVCIQTRNGAKGLEG